MSGKMQSFCAPFRQRAPCAGLLLSAVAGIVVSDAQPGWWIGWAGASLLPATLVLKIRASFLSYLSILSIFASWHGFQIASNSGYQRSQQAIFDTSEHKVKPFGASGNKTTTLPL